MKISLNEWDDVYTKFKSLRKDDNDFGLTKEKNLEINALLSISLHHDHNSVSLDDCIKAPKRNFFYFDGIYYYERFFGIYYWHNIFSTYKDLYDYIYLHEFLLVIDSVNYHPSIKMETYIDVIKNTNLKFEIDDYWILRMLLFFFKKSESNKNLLILSLDIIISKCDRKDITKSLRTLSPNFINFCRLSTIKKIKSNI
jgi:hypothetical protein